MKRILRSVLTGLACLAASVILTTNARAQCSAADAYLAPTMQKQAWAGSPSLRMIKVGQDRDEQEDIVGMWNIVLTSYGSAGIPDGTVLDRGLQQWHNDGTEMLNSSGQKPATQNYCLGTYEKVGRSTYALNHFAYNYDAAQNLIGITRIREVVTVNRDGKTFTGTFQIDGYDNSRNHLVKLTGRTTATRITVDTTARDVL